MVAGCGADASGTWGARFWWAGGSEEGLAEADDGVGELEAGGSFGGGFQERGELREGGGEGVGDLLLAAARGEGFEGLDPGLDVGLAGPEKDVAGGEGLGLGEGEEVAAVVGEGVEEDSIGG